MRYLLLLVLLVSCDKYYVNVKKEYIDAESLASLFVRSPDPRSVNPPQGQVLVMQWNLPRESMEQELMMQLRIIYRDYEEEVVSYPIKTRRGFERFALMDKRLEETGGFLTYKVEVLTIDGQVVQKWQQQLWVNLITLDKEDEIEL